MKSQYQKGNAIIWITIVVILVLVTVGLWWWFSQPIAGPAVTEPLTSTDIQKDLDATDTGVSLGGDTTANIQKDLDAIDTGADLKGDLDRELDADINSL